MSRDSRLHAGLGVALLLCLYGSLLAQEKPQSKVGKPTLEQAPGCSLDTKLDTDHALEILSDTEGVDFGPYLRQVLHQVQTSWYAVIPQAAYPPLREKGVVVLAFRILKNGSVADLKFVCRSDDVVLDRAAYAGVSKSAPFSPLPKEFHGDALALRIRFFYNPDAKNKSGKTPPPASQR